MRLRLIGWCVIALLACGGDDDGDSGQRIDAGDVADAAGPAADAAESGRTCVSGLGIDDPTVISSPSLECPSRVCLHVQGNPPDMCAAFCEQADDCLAAAETPCDEELVCAAPMDEGPFACRKVCVCAAAVPEGGFPVDCGN